MNLLFDFTVDKATNTIHVTREFAAGLYLVPDHQLLQSRGGKNYRSN